MRAKTILLTVVILAMCIAGVSRAEWMANSKFTYQGRLYDSNSPAEGSYDLQFELYESPEEGLRVADPFNLYGVVILSGEFSVMVDFGELQADPNMLTGQERWLEVAVRESDPCAVDGYIALSPRQELTPTPYAHVAGTDLDWTVEGDNMFSAVPGVVAIGVADEISLPAVQAARLYVSGTTVLASNCDPPELIPEVDDMPLYVAGTTVMALADDAPELIPEVDGMPLYVAGTAVVGRPSSGDKLDVYGNVKIRGGVIQDAGGIERIALNEPGPTELKADDGSVGLMLTAPEVMVGFRSDPCNPIPVLKVGSDGGVDIGLTDPCLSAIPEPIPIMRASADGSVDIGVALVSAIPQPIPKPIMRIDTEGSVRIGIGDPCDPQTGVITVGSDGSASMGSDPCNHVPILTVDSAGNVDIGVDLVSLVPIPLPIPIMEINTDGSVGIGIADPCDPAPRVITVGSDGSVGIGADSSDPDASIITVSAEGNVGIGVTDPTYKLHMVNGEGAYIESTAYAARFNATATTGKAVYAEASAASGTNYAVHGKTNSSDGYAGYFEGRSYFSGNVGFSIASPARSLHVSAAMRLQPGSAPLSPAEGDMYMDSGTHKLMVYDGTEWQACW